MDLLMTGRARKLILQSFMAPLFLCAVWASFAQAQELERKEEFAAELFKTKNLTGDWGGLRSKLFEKGLNFEVEYFGDYLTNLTGGLRRRSAYSGLLNMEMYVDTQKLAGWQGGKFFVFGIGTHGSDPTENVGSVHAVSNLEAFDTFKLLENWYEQTLFDGKLAVLGGLYAVDAEFDVKETAALFLNGGFGTGLDLSETGLNGPSIFPTTALGARVKVRPLESLYYSGAALDGVPGKLNDPNGTKVRLDRNDGWFSIHEMAYEFIYGPDFPARVGVGGWFYTTRLDDVRDVDDNGDPVKRSGTHGVYGFVEGTLFSEKDSPGQRLQAFFRAGSADEDVNQFGYYVSGGFIYTGLFPGRNEDVAGFAVSSALNGGKFKAAQRDAGTAVNNAETALEWTYKIKVFPWLKIQPDFQYIINPGSDPAIDNAFVGGFRFEIAL